MEDVMETCWIDSVTMCSRGYKCETCYRNLGIGKEQEKSSRDVLNNKNNYTFSASIPNKDE